MRKNVLTTSEAGKYCQSHLETVKNWIRRGELPAFRTPGGHYRIRKSDLDDFLKKHNMVTEGEIESPRMRILIVDDDPLVLTSFMSLLRSHDPSYEIATAVDGYEAGEMVSTFKPDVVILDLIMPGLDGFKVCRRIKRSAQTRDIRILAVTGYPEGGNINEILNCGADECLTKPVNPEELCEKVEKLLSVHQK